MKGTCIPSVISDMITQSGLLTFLNGLCATINVHPSNEIALALPRLMRSILQGFSRSDPEWHGTCRKVWLQNIGTVVLTVMQGIAKGMTLENAVKMETAAWWSTIILEASLLLRYL